jgi:hypothetical protein
MTLAAVFRTVTVVATIEHSEKETADDQEADTGGDAGRHHQRDEREFHLLVSRWEAVTGALSLWSRIESIAGDRN